ncbi:RNase adapter RapZ [Salsipaludibacter albus]|uniref:RNase adapter RapZ n=1 Tax=Salsipaludibacter albus TaxID=2849650 RepID=UPI001EE433BC
MTDDAATTVAATTDDDHPSEADVDAARSAEQEVEAALERPRIVVITGLSGAGRTQVAKVLEDLDYFVIDNLPPALIPKVRDLAFGPGGDVERLAVVADVRGRAFFPDLVEVVRTLGVEGANVRIVYLEADDDTLVARFESTRRRHPAAGDHQGVLEAIRDERTQMVEIRGLADIVVDTSDLNVHELRDRIIGLLGDEQHAKLRVKVLSFGFKYGAPRDADMVMDVRFLPNPHWVDALRPYTGLDDAVRDYVFGQPETEPFVDAFERLLEVVVPGYVGEGKRYLTIAIGCTGGKHRSVAIAEHVADYLASSIDQPVVVAHRDVGRQ